MNKMGFQQWYRENIAGKGYNPKTAARLAWIYLRSEADGE